MVFFCKPFSEKDHSPTNNSPASFVHQYERCDPDRRRAVATATATAHTTFPPPQSPNLVSPATARYSHIRQRCQSGEAAPSLPTSTKHRSPTPAKTHVPSTGPPRGTPRGSPRVGGSCALQPCIPKPSPSPPSPPTSRREACRHC